jgi:hypothetical protein
LPCSGAVSLSPPAPTVAPYRCCMRTSVLRLLPLRHIDVACARLSCVCLAPPRMRTCSRHLALPCTRTLAMLVTPSP